LIVGNTKEKHGEILHTNQELMAKHMPELVFEREGGMLKWV
jgi:hypothetical protein